jgi:hypothetical protein
MCTRTVCLESTQRLASPSNRPFPRAICLAFVSGCLLRTCESFGCSHGNGNCAWCSRRAGAATFLLGSACRGRNSGDVSSACSTLAYSQ